MYIRPPDGWLPGIERRIIQGQMTILNVVFQHAVYFPGDIS